MTDPVAEGLVSRKYLYFKVAVFCLLLGVGLVALFLLDFDVTRIFEGKEEISPWLFVLCMSVLPVIGFPIAAFYLFAGMAFGFWEAWLYCLVSLVVNMSLSYLVARYLLRDSATRLIQKAGYEPSKLSEMNQIRLIFLLRVVPGAPFPVQNYLLAVLGIPFGTYLILSLLLQGTIAAGVVACGGALPQEITAGHIIIGLALISILVGAKTIYHLRTRNKKTI